MRRVLSLLGGVACALGCSLAVEVLRSESANIEPRARDCVVRYFRDYAAGRGALGWRVREEPAPRGGVACRRTAGSGGLAPAPARPLRAPAGPRWRSAC